MTFVNFVLNFVDVAAARPEMPEFSAVVQLTPGYAVIVQVARTDTETGLNLVAAIVKNHGTAELSKVRTAVIVNRTDCPVGVVALFCGETQTGCVYGLTRDPGKPAARAIYPIVPDSPDAAAQLAALNPVARVKNFNGGLQEFVAGMTGVVDIQYGAI